LFCRLLRTSPASLLGVEYGRNYSIALGSTFLLTLVAVAITPKDIAGLYDRKDASFIGDQAEVG
jgi:hypothetical protein